MVSPRDLPGEGPVPDPPGDGPIVTLDGPAGSGKSTTAKAVAARLGFRHLDSGALYRALTLALLESGIPESEWDKLLDPEIKAFFLVNPSNPPAVQVGGTSTIW